MRIANNIMAMNTHRSYTINNNNISKSAEKLSSGYRVNRAGDDAAGLAISEKMRSQIRGLNMASKNSQDGNSAIQTAEGALQEVHSVLQRMNELSVQSATGTNQTLDRNALNAEFQQLVAEIDDIAAQTTFNDMNMLDGSFQVKYEIAGTIVGETSNDVEITGQYIDVNLKESGRYTVTANGTEITMTQTENGGTTTTVNTTVMDLKDLVQNVNLNAEGTVVKKDDTFYLDLTTFGLGSYEVTANDDLTAQDVIADLGVILAKITGTDADTDDANAIDKAMKIQVGAKEGELMDIGIDKIDAATLAVDKMDISTQEAAGRAVSVTRTAINVVSTVRGALGAAQNRLDHKIANLATSAENLAAAESRIRDVDMASEMTNFTKNNILSQAATSMLAQANALPQNVLSLLQ